MSACIFCAIVAGQERASLVYENAATLAFMDLRQQADAHVLVIPKAHVETIDLLDDATAAALMQAVVRVAAAMQRSFAPEGLTLWQSNGEAAYQEVPHVHMHLTTRHTGDGLLRVYPRHPAPSDRGALDAVAARIRSALVER